jgi:hypothetical protein
VTSPWRNSKPSYELWGGWGGSPGVPSAGVSIVGAPAAVSSPTGVKTFVVGSDGALWQNTLTGSSWSGWTSLGGNSAQTPAVTNLN